MSSSENKGSFPLSRESVLVIVGFDWLVYAVNMLSELSAVTLVAVGFSLLAGALCAGLELRSEGRSFAYAFGSAATASLLVALPLPVMGTVLGMLGLVWWMGTALTGSRAQA